MNGLDGTWEQIKDVFLLCAGSSYTAGATGGAKTHTHTNPTTGSTTLTSSHIPQHSHSVGAHSHGLNSHVHSVGAHHHGLNSHTHSFSGYTGNRTATSGSSQKEWGNSLGWVGGHAGGIAYANSQNTYCQNAWKDYAGEHRHSFSGTTGAASGNTANSTAFNTGAASGSTANSTAFNTGAWGTASPSGHTHTVGNTGSSSSMPPYLVIYAWKRTA